MNKIDRSLVKSQAKQIIKNKIFVLFLISAIVLILVNGLSFGVSTYYSSDALFGPSNDNSYSDNQSGQNTPEDFFKYFNGGDSNSNDNSGSYNYGGDASDNPIESFGQDNNQNQSYSKNGSAGKLTDASIKTVLTPSNIGVRFLNVLSLVLSPLLVSLCGLYVVLIKRDPNEEFKLGKEIGNIFKTSFDASYGHKILLFILRYVFMFLWTILLIIPGIVYYYTSYFAYQIMCENPNLKPTEALKLSKKMVMGNRGELFELDLSFLGWWLLCGITFGLANIYVIPYYFTTQALYYENFKIRALQEGRITMDDFLSEQEKAQKYGFNANNAGNYYNPNANVNNAQGYQNQNAQASQQSTNGYYYNPQQNVNANAQNTAPNYANTNEQSTTQQYAYNPNASHTAEAPKENEPIQKGEYPSYTNENNE